MIVFFSKKKIVKQHSIQKPKTLSKTHQPKTKHGSSTDLVTIANFSLGA